MPPTPPRKTANVRQRQLGMSLRRLREKTGMSADDVGEAMGMSQTKVSRIEGAQTGVSKGDLFLMLSIYGIEDKDEKERYWALALAGKSRGWWNQFVDIIGESQAQYVAFEDAAESICAWSLGTIHGLLQTEAYARTTFMGGPPLSPENVDRVVKARLERQHRLGSGNLKLWAILDESLLNRPVGGPAVLRDQLDHLLRLPSDVTVQVVPMGTSWHPGLICSFTLMGFEDYPDVAFAENSFGDSSVDTAEGVAAFRLVFDQLRAAGADPEASRRMIRAARDRIEES
jgi:transcriptional regulator with XRE-family HTH domain